MSGPVTMSLGPYAFEALGFGYTDVGRNLDVPWVDIPVASGFNPLQFTGPKSDSVTIKGVLFPIALGGAAGLEGIRKAGIAGKPLMLVSLGGKIFGNYVVEGVKEDRTYHDRRGTPGQNSYEISLKYYPGTVGGGFSITLGGVLNLLGS
ncbi:phage tail protein [Mesorhizobium sp. Cs1299R1N3]|uniref:phage tail protein n=1 Tax=Mesorhizobium sp. Cs1299R1N3 TaxID=3015173 RepID=UPI00301D1484